jgi:hypothetical protein
MPGLKGGINRGARVPSIFALASSCAASSRFSSPVACQASVGVQLRVVSY